MIGKFLFRTNRHSPNNDVLKQANIREVNNAKNMTNLENRTIKKVINTSNDVRRHLYGDLDVGMSYIVSLLFLSQSKSNFA